MNDFEVGKKIYWIATHVKHFSVEIPMTPSKSNCSKFGHKLAIFSKSRSVRPRMAARNSFFKFGQPFSNSFRLSPGEASSRKLSTKIETYFDQSRCWRQANNLPPTKINLFQLRACGKCKQSNRRETMRFPHIDWYNLSIVLRYCQRHIVHIHLAKCQIYVFQFAVILQ